LQSLDCSETEVSDLTPLQGLNALEYLDCSETEVRDLAALQGLNALQLLDCSETEVSDLTPLIDHPSLRALNASNCSLSDFPRRLVMGDTLTELKLHEATIPGVPGEVLSEYPSDNCLDRLRAHLNDLEAGTEEVREAKLVVLGNGRVGKTQICRRLRGLPYDEKVPSTHGITVTSEPWSGSDEDEALNIWDFGGQDIYHGAHTLFMKTSAVFLVVWHPDFETVGEQTVDGMVFRNYPLPYWLEYIRTLARKDCPVVVAQARCDRPEQEVRRLPADDAFLRFPSLKPCWYSAKADRGQGALEEALRDAIRFLRERDGIATIGKGRMRVLRQLEAWRNEDQARPTTERRHRTLSQEEFRSLCEKKGDVSSPESLLAYLHNLGVVFYQPDLFLERIILDQSWALEAVYGVFDRRKAYPLILSQGGRFTRSLLAMTAWRDYSDPEQRLFLSLMQACGIAFVHRQEDRRLGLETEYLAPDVLPAKDAGAAQLAGRWNDQEESWRLEYEYPFLHPGLMRALLCDVGERSHEAGVYWKYGVWVYEKGTGCRAMLEQQMTDERQGRITLKVQGRRHEELVRWLRKRIEERNRLFGYPELAPAVDEFGPATRFPEPGPGPYPGRVGRKAGHPAEPTADDRTREARAERAAQEPAFDKPPASFFPPREPQVFVSYAWGDETPEGRQRGKVVDELYAKLGDQGVHVRRDRDELRPGELISEFMDRLAEGDFILAVISDKYLRSEYCMYELFRIYRNCADKPERFLRKVIPLILPDARVDSLANRLQRAIHWTKQEEELQPLIEGHVGTVGTEFFRKFKLIGEFARNTSNMLEYLVDKLQPRDFERQAREGFQEVLSQIRPVS
jgi:internalin A